MEIEGSYYSGQIRFNLSEAIVAGYDMNINGMHILMPIRCTVLTPEERAEREQKAKLTIHNEIVHKFNNKLNRRLKITNPILALNKQLNRFNSLSLIYKSELSYLSCVCYGTENSRYARRIRCTYILLLLHKIRANIEHLQRYKIDQEELVRECYKPARVMYQYELDPEYADN